MKMKKALKNSFLVDVDADDDDDGRKRMKRMLIKLFDTYKQRLVPSLRSEKNSKWDYYLLK